MQVRNLEKDYGVRLFDRSATGVQLTRQGATLFELTRKLFSVEDDIRDVLNSNYQQLTGDLKIGVDNPLVAMPLVKAYRARFPGVRLDLIPGNSQAVWLDLDGACERAAELPGAASHIIEFGEGGALVATADGSVVLIGD